jgi:hypothetical protein
LHDTRRNGIVSIGPKSSVVEAPTESGPMVNVHGLPASPAVSGPAPSGSLQTQPGVLPAASKVVYAGTTSTTLTPVASMLPTLLMTRV